MSRFLTDDEVAEELRCFAHTAFRLELQREYEEPAETVERFLAGDPEPPEEVPEFRAWDAQVRALTSQGKRIERVRVHDDPPTPYQRWLRWSSRSAVLAGEVIHYMTRERAYEAGLLPAAGQDDWWLLDDRQLLVLRFDDNGHLVEVESITDRDRVEQAGAWRDVAVDHSTPDPAGVSLP